MQSICLSNVWNDQADFFPPVGTEDVANIYPGSGQYFCDPYLDLMYSAWEYSYKQTTEKCH